jgi:hypothetical protein
VIDGLAVQVAGDTTVIECATMADRLAVLDALMGALRSIVADLGLPRAIRVTDSASPGEKHQARADDQQLGGVSPSV